MNYLQFLKLAAPETIVVLAALAALAADLLTLRDLEPRFRRLIGSMIAVGGCAGAVAWILAVSQPASLMEGMLVSDSLVQLMQVAVLVLAILTLLLFVDADFTDHVGEYVALVLLAAVGMMLLVSSEDLLMIFVSLELTSLALYILTGFNKRNVKSAEAALKYFLFGGMAAAFTLFGVSLLYGLAGSTNLSEIGRILGEKHSAAASAAPGASLDPLLITALVMTVVGFGFKVAAVPFHLWAPDAYEGAPTPSAAFIASGSKVASFFIFAKVIWIGFAGAGGSGGWHAFLPGWVPVLAVVAAASIVLGNLVALAQVCLRRLLAYSAIAHAGYMLLGITNGDSHNLAPLIYYVTTYGLTTLGAFGVVAVVQQRTGNDRLTDFAGLSRRCPLVAFCMMIFMLSLAGIPPLAGFFGKFYLFASALGGPQPLSLLWLVSVALAMSAVSLYYYLQVLKQIYLAEPRADSAAPISIFSQVVVALVAAAVVILGCAPSLLLTYASQALQIAGR
jgi:NADH-quinone oxidoreductase subunit N